MKRCTVALHADEMLSRRTALGLIGSCALATPLGASAWTLSAGRQLEEESRVSATSLSAASSWQDSLLQKRRVLRLYNPRSKERARVAFWDPKEGVIGEGYRHVCWLLRDVKAGIWSNMDLELLNKLYGIQAWLDYYGIDPEMDVLSGLRTPQTNGATEGAALLSRHLYGEAVDVRIRRVNAVTLGKMAQAFGPGGVGFYVNSNYVHVDTGRTRTWKK